MQSSYAGLLSHCLQKCEEPKEDFKSELLNESGIRDPVGYLREESSFSSIQTSFQEVLRL